MAQIYIPSSLRAQAGQQSCIGTGGATAGAALAELLCRYPELRPHLCADDGTLLSFVHVFVNGDDIRFLQGDATPLGARDEVSIILPVAGG